MRRFIALSVVLTLLAVPQARLSAQDLPIFSRWANDSKFGPAVPCRIEPYFTPPNATHSQAAAIWALSRKKPFFPFSGSFRRAEAGCLQVGPITLNGHKWYLQDVRALTPYGKCENEGAKYCHVSTLRICSTTYSSSDQPIEGTETPQATLARRGPFGGKIGPGGCEKLWYFESNPPLP